MSQPFPSSGAPGEVSSIEPVLEARRPCCPRCGDGELVDALVSRPEGMALWAVYCAGVFDRSRRRLARRSCGYLGGTAADLRAGANSSDGSSAGGVSVSAMRQPR